MDAERLRSALRRLVERHDALRTRFELRAGLTIPVQEVREELRVPELSPGAEGDWREGLRVRWSANGTELEVVLSTLTADPWSMGVLAGELADLYAGRELPEALQYPRFAAFQNQICEEEGEDRAEALAHWRRVREAGASPRLGLPALRAAEPGPFDRIEHVRVPLEPGVVDAGCGRLGIDPAAVLAAIWGSYLTRWTGGTATVGHLLHGRDHEVLERTIGPIARACPVHFAPYPDETLARLAARTEGALEEAAEWADHLDLETLFADEPTGTGGPPRFDALFELDRRWPEPTGDGPWIVAKRLVTEPFAVRVGVRPTEDGLVLELSHDPRRIDGDTMTRFGTGLAAFADAALADPERRLLSLPLIDEGERRRLLVEVQRGAETDEDAPLSTVPEQIRDAARRDPAAIAVIDANGRIDRAHLAARSGALARRLRRAGVAAGSTVGLCCEPSVDLVVALVGTLEAGAAYVPIDPDLPRARRNELLEQVGAVALVTGGGGADALTTGCALVSLEGLEAEASRGEGDGAPGAGTVVDPDQLAYVLFTSGSSGEPKGVAVSHRQLASYVRAIGRRLSLDEEKPLTFGLVSTVAADLGNTVLFPALCGAGPLVVVDSEAASDAERLARRYAEHGVDVLKIVPSHLKALLGGDPGDPRVLPRRLLICGGEALDPDLVARVRSLSPGLRIVNHYGPTETTVGVVAHELPAGAATSGRGPDAPIPIGSPLPGCVARLLDPELGLVPAGIDGELFLGGDQVARGYHQRPAATAERFVPDPWATEAGARIYRSGDVCRLLPSGELVFRGRADHQIKIRGFRVEPDEVGRRLETHPDVARAVVTARRGAAGNTRLVAYVEPRHGAGGGGETETLPNGLSVEHLNRNETRHLYRQIFQDRIYDRYGTVYEDDAVIFDVGANIGMFTLFASLRCRRPRVFAFEPSPYAFEKLSRNVERHGVAATLFNLGVSDRTGEAELTVYPRVSIMSGFHADAAQEADLFRRALVAEGHGGADDADELAAGRFEAETRSCGLTTVSAVIREHGVERIDLLKIDAEKSELEVMEGVDAEDWPKVRQVLAEVHAIGDRVERVRRLLEDQGFRVTVEEDTALAGTGIFHVHASRLAPGQDSEPGELAPIPSVAPLTEPGLRDMLRETLPSYMVPEQVVFLDRVPLTRNGKVDRAALPDPEEAARRAHVEPVTEIERVLADIWCAVLHRDRVSLEDNFFELGGDSILSIQVAARARQAGLDLATREIFRHQTLRELAESVEIAVPRVTEDEEPAAGPIPALPIQRWFQEEGFADPHHFNQAVLLAVRRPLRADHLHRVIGGLVARHDALRLCQRNGGELEIVAEAPTPFAVVDLSSLPDDRRPATVTAVSAALQASLDPSSARVARFARLDLGADGARLAAVIHHLSVDAVSWRVLLADIESAYRDLAAGGEGTLPPRGGSLRGWAERLDRLAADPDLLAEAPYWAAELAGADPLPAMAVKDAVAGNAETVVRHLEETATHALLTQVPAAYRVRVPEVMLAALVAAVHHRQGLDDLRVMLEGHGREELFEDADASRTVGWLTTHYPVRLRVPAAGADDAGALLKSVKEHLRRVPRGGVGYGLMRHVSPTGPEVAALREGSPPILKFNYLGSLDQVLPEASLFAPAPEDRGRDRSRRGHRPYPFEIESAVIGGRLRVAWVFPAGRGLEAVVEPLADELVDRLDELIAHCLAAEDAGHTPSDFPMIDLGQEGLEEALLEADFETRSET